MRKRRALFLISMLAWLLLTAVQFTQAQQSSNESTLPIVSNVQGIVFVVGAVRSPARFELRRNVSLTELLDCVGGLSPDAKNPIYIYRRRPGDSEAMLIAIDLKAIRNNKADDLAIQPYDIVEVRSKKAKNSGDCFSTLCFKKWLDKLNELPLRSVK